MLSWRDCLDMAGVTEDEVEAIAAHEHLPSMVALELGYHLLGTPEGVQRLRQFLVEDIAAAQATDNCCKCVGFSQALAKFLENHPEARESDTAKAQRLKGLSAFGQADDLAAGLEATGLEATGLEAAGSEQPDPVRQCLLDEIENVKQRHDCSDCEKWCLEFGGRPS